jgi:dTDP-4-dehydrorhamnose reductase
MKILLTGATGAVGQAVQTAAKAAAQQIIPWNRHQVPVTDPTAMAEFIQGVQPELLIHLATASTPTGLENEGWRVNVEWSTHLAQICAAAGVRMIFTSSVMVFTDDAVGPFTPDSVPDAQSGYGYEKFMAEEAILRAHANAVVVRLGWQIGTAPGSNNMIDFFSKQMAEQGAIGASTQWLPACSFLADTAEMLLRAATVDPGRYLFDSNRRWNFYEIAAALNEMHGRPWQIRPNTDFNYDQRMQDPRLAPPSLAQRLPALRPT